MPADVRFFNSVHMYCNVTYILLKETVHCEIHHIHGRDYA
jgi:hypothetical protein